MNIKELLPNLKSVMFFLKSNSAELQGNLFTCSKCHQTAIIHEKGGYLCECSSGPLLDALCLVLGVSEERATDLLTKHDAILNPKID